MKRLLCTLLLGTTLISVPSKTEASVRENLALGTNSCIMSPIPTPLTQFMVLFEIARLVKNHFFTSEQEEQTNSEATKEPETLHEICSQQEQA